MQCGLLGEKLGHSYSPQIHAELADYEYRLYEKAPDEVEAFIRQGDWHGLNVTIPYKKTVVPFCDELSETAALYPCWPFFPAELSVRHASSTPAACG